MNHIGTWARVRATPGHRTRILSLSAMTTMIYLSRRLADFVISTMFHSFGFIHIVVAPRSLVQPYLGPSHSFRFQLDSWTTHYTRSPDSLYQAVHHPSIFLLWEYTYLYTFDSCNAPFQLVCSARPASGSSSWMSLFCYAALFVAALLGYVYPISRPIKKWMAHTWNSSLASEERCNNRLFAIVLIRRFRICLLLIKLPLYK